MRREAGGSGRSRGGRKSSARQCLSAVSEGTGRVSPGSIRAGDPLTPGGVGEITQSAGSAAGAGHGAVSIRLRKRSSQIARGGGRGIQLERVRGGSSDRGGKPRAPPRSRGDDPAER